MFNLDVIIRTRNSGPFLKAVIDSLNNSEGVNCNFIFVDHSSIDDTIHLLPKESTVLNFPSLSYNYSKAINLAINHLKFDYALVISSHNVIQNQNALNLGCKLLQDRPDVAAVTLSGLKRSEVQEEITELSNFNGWNGAWNTCTIYKSALLKKRKFRTEVFSAEDQEWSKWVMEKENKIIVHIKGVGINNLNPQKHNEKKLVREWESIAYYTYRDYLKSYFILKIVKKALREARKRQWLKTIFWTKVALALAKAKMMKPQHSSNYY